MYGVSTAAQPPPRQSSSSSMITSLTSRSKTKQCGASTITTTSLAEALATSVADLVCDSKHRKLINGSSTTSEEIASESKPTRQQNTVTNNVETQSATSTTRSSSSQPPASATSAPRSSMSSAVADLASGMSIFHSANISSTKKRASESSSFQNDRCRNFHYSTKSAPIISGTAAAVLALQSASLHENHSNCYDNIVSFNSARGSIGKRIFTENDAADMTVDEKNRERLCAGGGSSHVPNPLLTTTSSHSLPQGGDSVARNVSSPTITTTGSYQSPSSSNNNSSPSTSSSSLPKFPTRYPDGAPIIAGTAAAAQMEANIATAATATAARLTSLSSNDIDDTSNCGIIHAVASLGPCVVGGTHQSHGFSSPVEDAMGGGDATEPEYHYWTGSSTAPLTITTQGSNALSWMDHRANYLRVTPEDGSSTAGGYSFNSSPANPVALVSSSSQQCTSTTSTGRGGGMDILAEITCHAPPMILPANLSHSTTFNVDSYLPPSSEIISGQETYHSVLPTSPLSPQASQVHHHLISSPIINDQQRVSIIPSYQEIYREMGIPHQNPDNQRHQHHAHHYSTSSYSVEEIEVDACHLSHTSDHHHNQQPYHVDPTDPSISQPHSRTPTLHFGQVNRDNIEEGKELYTRKDLYHFGGHASESKDVHGNMKDGCDSIVIGNLEKDLRECDGLLWFLFSTDRINGGGALCQSYHKKRPIRVFRSSLLGGKYAPPYLDVEDDVEEDSDVAYRYDGLYMVRAVWDIQGQETESHPICGENGWQTYFFTRLPKRPLEKEKWEGGMEYNAMGCQELWSTIQKMRGVRKPKKFEIPTPPVKLGQMKKCAITGQLKERKRAGYVKPIVEIDAASSKPLSKSKRRAHDENRRNIQQEDKMNSSEMLSLDAGIVDDSDSDSYQKKQHHTPSHLQSPSKVLTPRPRLNSFPDLKKTSPTNHHDNDADSSDSDSISSDLHFSSKIDRSKATPSNVNNVESSSGFDSSIFFPKRASAARAEAANRHMFGGSRSYKRKSSESAAAAAYQQSRSGAGRKRIKIRHRDDSSSSEEEQSPDLVDSSILTIGSRVLVSYKGSLFKATVRKRREKTGTHDFLIHYDGNKKSNVHWICSDRINKILEINVDSPPLKIAPIDSHKRKKINAGKKRKSVQNQESIESNNTDGTGDRELSEEGVDALNSCGKSKDDEESVKESKTNGEHEEKIDVSSNVEKNNDMQKPLIEAKISAGEIAKLEMKECISINDTPEGLVVESVASVDVDELEHEIALEKVASIRNRDTTVSDVCFAQVPRPSRSKGFTSHSDITIYDTTNAEADHVNELHEKETDENSQSSLGEPTPKHTSCKTSKFKFSEGGQVYVEYRHILYSSTILKCRKKRSKSEYLVHYEGYKKSSNTWVKESTLHEVNAVTTQRFDEQRLCQADSLDQSEQSSDFQEVTNRKTGRDGEPPPSDSCNQSAIQKKPPTRRTRSDASDVTLDTLSAGVSFLAGSMVFVEWTGALYLAKMLKKRYSGEHMEYLISYDGYKSNHDAWVSVRKIYEVNPQTKRVFKKLSFDFSASGDGKQKRPAPPGPKQRETRRKSDHDEEDTTPRSDAKNLLSLTRASSQSSRASSSSVNTQMQGIETGVEFLPGSTLFAVYRDGLCLAKMLKKRGKGDYTEYLVQFNGLKKTEEAWVSTGLVYEINPQTKRMFRQLSVTK